MSINVSRPVTPWSPGGGNGFALDSGTPKKPCLETTSSLAIMVTLFPRCSTSATWQIYRALTSCHLNMISPYPVSSFSRTCECSGFLKIPGPKPYALLLSSEQVSQPHFQHFGKFLPWRRSGHLDISNFVPVWMCHLASSLTPAPHSISLAIGASRAAPLTQGSRLQCVVPHCLFLIQLFICNDVRMPRATVCITYSKVFWKVCFWYLPK